MEIESQEYIHHLRWKLERLKSEIMKTKFEIEERNSLLADKQQQVEHVLKLLESEGVQIDRTELDGIIPVSLGEVIKKILKTKKKPMHYKDIAAAVLETGHKIPGQNPPATIIALLHRKKDEFARLDSGIWGLTEWNINVQKKTRKTKRKRHTKKK
jgi:hypothetical protein